MISLGSIWRLGVWGREQLHEKPAPFCAGFCVLSCRRKLKVEVFHGVVYGLHGW